MGKDSSIEWTHHTFNPWLGCVKVSPECDNCYAEADRKWSHLWGKDAPRQVTSDPYWRQVARWNKLALDAGERHRVFCGSYCDVMEDFDGELLKGGCNDDLQDIRKWLYGEIGRCKSLDFLLLTKRPQNFRRFLPESWIAYPLPNVWGMTTVGARKSLWRIDALRDTPFTVRCLSIEPLVEDLGTLDLRGIHGVIVGGESGHHARPMQPDWARSIRDQCIASGVKFFFKQWGEHDSGLVRIGKKRAGRLLDGRTWDELPEVRN
jgi:protein gp37